MGVVLYSSITPTDPSVETIAAAMENPQTAGQTISVNSMTSGEVEVVYQSPNRGRVSLYLYNSNQDVLIVIDARYDWEGEKNKLVLNSKHANAPWDVPAEVHPKGFPFPCCGYVTTISLRVKIGDGDFTISANGLEIAKYPYREGLHPPVTDIQCILDDGDAPMQAKIESLSVYY